MPDLLKVGQSGRARFTDTPADRAGSLNSSPNLVENERWSGTTRLASIQAANNRARWSAYRAALVQDAAAKFGD